MTPFDIFTALKATPYNQKYFDYMEMSQKPNPLVNVVPLEGSDFFGTKVCNILIINSQLFNWDSDSVDAAFNRLKATYDFFAKYETHFIVDKDATDISDPSTLKLVTDNFNNFVATYPVADYGITYWGPMANSDIEPKVESILAAFYGS